MNTQSSATMLMNGLIAGNAVTRFEDTNEQHCFLLNVSIGCSWGIASVTAEYLEQDGSLTGVGMRFECQSAKQALKTLYSFARQVKSDVGMGDVVRHFAYDHEVYDYTVIPMSAEYQWFDYSELA